MIQPIDERSAALIERAVSTLGESSREVVMNVYSLGVIDGQLQALDRASSIFSEVRAS